MLNVLVIVDAAAKLEVLAELASIAQVPTANTLTRPVEVTEQAELVVVEAIEKVTLADLPVEAWTEVERGEATWLRNSIETVRRMITSSATANKALASGAARTGVSRR